MRFRQFISGVLIGVILVYATAVFDRSVGVPFADTVARELGFRVPDSQTLGTNATTVSQPVLSEELSVVDVAEKSSKSVVTVGIKTTQRYLRRGSGDLFGMLFQPNQIDEKLIERDIGSGFIVRADGLVVTNKHVVNDTEAEYVVITHDGEEYPVTKIDRDPLNDLAILQIDANGLEPISLGDSDSLKVGQFVIAIGTALGEFRQTVTTGVISGLGRGIVAGDYYSRSAEEIDNVIQTDAAINPGNSGGPLLNSAGQVIGVNVAVASGSENIGFALPINLIKDALVNFEQRGGFEGRAYLGVKYFMVSRQAALANEVPEGAYVEEVVEEGPAAQNGIEAGDIVTKIAGEALKDVEGGLAGVVSQKRAGDVVDVEYWRDGETKTVRVTLETLE